ncbi:MAG: hypothetical protein PHW18_11350 [Sulfuricurvum sp.]|uniref:hypothetical protein n=1 Tax=Sulfuricurvum sp. TaxID=2025608 RepID=UPI00262CE050|nr:hypothetical protein [Sulfuricurvum sp.]MDD2830159.1 hypothetical protein [Sulfuricurvum sp.]MDD4950403.1 hypothetical protein [Sulfuricurvum sp.]
MRLHPLNRDEYLLSVSTITDTESKRFAIQALAWWDRHFSWKAQGCNVLIDNEGKHVCYIFSKIDRYSEYLTVYNLFTPLIDRRQGFAEELLDSTINHALSKHVRRIHFTSVSDSLDFYTSLGFIFWGINDIGHYYCDLPIPKNGLIGFEEMIKFSTNTTLLGSKMEKIYSKVVDNEGKLTLKQNQKHTANCLKLGDKWIYNPLSVLHYEARLSS